MLLALLACAGDPPPKPPDRAPDTAVDTAADTADTGCPPAYIDADHDGHGDPDASAACDDIGAVGDATDCDDADPARFPGAHDIARDGVDQDCDGVDRCATLTYTTGSVVISGRTALADAEALFERVQSLGHHFMRVESALPRPEAIKHRHSLRGRTGAKPGGARSAPLPPLRSADHHAASLWDEPHGAPGRPPNSVLQGEAFHGTAFTWAGPRAGHRSHLRPPRHRARRGAERPPRRPRHTRASPVEPPDRAPDTAEQLLRLLPSHHDGSVRSTPFSSCRSVEMAS